MEIRDTRNGDWHWVYNAVISDPHLSTDEKLVYSSISTFGGHSVIHPTIEQIARRCVVSDRTVQRALKTLEEVGYLSIERSTGRGNANVYYLLKSPKGCQRCTLSKGCQESTERVTETTVKGVPQSPHIDIYKDKKDTAQSAEIPAIINLFKEVNPSVGRLYGSPPQRDAVVRLLKEHGREKLAAMITFLPKSNASRYAPTITTPVQFENKLGELIAWSQKQKEVKNAHVAFV